MWKKEMWLDIFWEVVGSVLVAVSLCSFAIQANIPVSGFSGIALILNRLFGVPIGWTIMALNIPVALLCWRLIGRTFMLKSLRCMVISSLMIDYLGPLLPRYQGSALLAALVAGVIGGIGYAVIFMRKSSTGGADFIIMAIKAVKPHLKLGTVVFFADAGIIVVGGVLFNNFDGIIYGMIINYLYATMVDKVMWGINSGKVGLIVTEKGEEMCDRIDASSGRGSTILDGRGGYRKGKKQVVMVACSTKEMYQIQQTVKAVDDDSFMIIMSSNEVHGEGFQVV